MEDENTNPTVNAIVTDWLRQHGYDGLYDDWGECSCAVDDLFPCAGPGDNCRAGYRGPCCCGDGCDYHIGPDKPTDGARKPTREEP